LAVVAAVGLAAAGCGSSSSGSGSSGGSSSKSPITIGYISDLTGVAASTFADSPGGVQAVVAQVNAAGGINGHPINLVIKDDASSLAGNLSASQSLVQNDHAVAIIDYSSFAFAGASYLNKAGIPVVGSAFDGPEWATYSNMFTWAAPLESPVLGQLHTYTSLGVFLKDLGVTSFGGLGYGISPSSTDSILEANQSAQSQGIKVCYTNNSVPFGAVDFTADVLQIKNAGCQAVAGSFVEASDLALSTAMSQAGLGKVTQIYFTGYDQATTATAADSAGFNNDWVQASINFSPPSAAGSAFLSLLKKYDKSYSGGIPDFGLYGAAISAQLVMYGLKLAGANPTSQSFSTALRQVNSWNDNGLFISPVSFTGFGTEAMFPQTGCAYYEQLVNGQWHAYDGKPICGSLLTQKAPG
jgi:branched-chain amino acid transport system substrate-binding protein